MFASRLSRVIGDIVDEALALFGRLPKRYSDIRPPPIAPELLFEGRSLQALFSVRSERLRFMLW